MHLGGRLSASWNGHAAAAPRSDTRRRGHCPRAARSAASASIASREAKWALEARGVSRPPSDVGHARAVVSARRIARAAVSTMRSWVISLDLPARASYDDHHTQSGVECNRSRPALRERATLRSGTSRPPASEDSALSRSQDRRHHDGVNPPTAGRRPAATEVDRRHHRATSSPNRQAVDLAGRTRRVVARTIRSREGLVRPPEESPPRRRARAAASRAASRSDEDMKAALTAMPLTGTGRGARCAPRQSRPLRMPAARVAVGRQRGRRRAWR